MRHPVVLSERPLPPSPGVRPMWPGRLEGDLHGAACPGDVVLVDEQRL